MKTSKSFLLAFLGGILFISAQENKKLDSLLSVYNSQPESKTKADAAKELSNLLRHDRPEESYLYATEALKISNNIGYKRGKGYAFLSLALYYRFLPNIDSSRYHYKNSIQTFKGKDLKTDLWTALNEYATFETLQGDFEKAISLADEGQKIAIELNSGTKLIDNLQRKSTIYMDTGDFKLAMKETLKASEIADTISPPNLKRKAVTFADIGRIEMLRGHYSKAIIPIKQSLEIFEKLQNDLWLAIVSMELGNVYWYLKDYDAAYENYKKSLKISRKLKRNDFITSNLSNLGLISKNRKQYDEAIKYLEEASRIKRQGGSSINNIIIGYNNLGTLYFEIKSHKKSMENHSIAIKLADSINALDILRDGYSGRSRAFEGIGDFKNALLDQRNYQIVNDSVFNTKKFKQIEELKTKYETEKKEQQIVLQEKEITVLEQQASISNLQKLLLGIGLILTLLGFYALRQKLKRNKLEKEKVDAELAFKKKELTTHALHLAKKNEVLESLKQKAQELKENEESKKGYQQLIRTINFDLQDDNNWENFARYFEEVHKDFNSNVKSKFPDVTSNELRLMALLKMNLSSKEIANILNISPEGIKKARYRLRKKLDITTEDSLQDLVLSL